MIPTDDLHGLGLAAAAVLLLVAVAVVVAVVLMGLPGDILIVSGPLIALAFVAAMAFAMIRGGNGE